MFLKCRSWYTQAGEARAAGSFLILVQPKDPPPDAKGTGGSGTLYHPSYAEETRAFVKYVILRQFGAWMSAVDVPVAGEKLYLSGSYGENGLVKTVSLGLWERGVPVPRELMEAWNKGGGHNGTGSEGVSMREWALANVQALRKAARTPASVQSVKLEEVLNA